LFPLTVKIVRNSFVCLFSGIFCLSGLNAQNLKDTLKLSEIEVRSSYNIDNQGYKRVKIDSVLLMPLLNGDLSTVLNQHSTVFIKSYGNGSLSTPSFRGTGSSHTQVEWNGIAINSPMLGQTDFSQLPVAQFDAIDILYGAATLARSSGVFGGIINLVSNPDWNNKFTLSVAQTVASFHNYVTNASISLGDSKIQSVVRFNYINELNDFPFYNEDRVKVKLPNAAYIQLGLTEETFFRLNRKNFLALRIWYSDNDHELAPITSNLDKTHNEKLYDRNIRSMAEWKYLEKEYSLTVRSALVDGFMRYTDTLATYNSQTYSWNTRARFVYSGIKKLSIKPGIDLICDWANTDNYITKTDSSGKRQRNTVGVFSEITYNINNKVGLTLVMREDVIDGKFLPFIPSLGAQYKPFNRINLSFSGNIARNYRYPSMNDLYYTPGGNPDLKPESDYSAEGGGVYQFQFPKKKLFLEAELTGYYSLINEMIIWSPVGGIWSPENISEVHSRGLEAGLNMGYKSNGLEVTLDNNYHYCRSTNEKAASPNDNQVGKQLKYVPVHTFNSTLGVQKRGFHATYNFCYISERYTGNDEKSMMPGYSLSNIILGKNFSLNKIILSLQVQINNLFDLDYQSIAQRPMPGRNFALSLKINFSK